MSRTWRFLRLKQRMETNLCRALAADHTPLQQSDPDPRSPRATLECGGKRGKRSATPLFLVPGEFQGCDTIQSGVALRLPPHSIKSSEMTDLIWVIRAA